ncbi:glycosyltransferase [Rhodococcus sp. NPDC079359]|uniref:glycosyltransferase n=1 Tax=Rhodococcus sp. NPDC079359 TaxID=3154961 RepID=UPI0034508687
MSTIFVEPNPFASRLQVLAPLVTAANLQQACTVVIPDRLGGTDFESFNAEIPATTRVIRVKDGSPKQATGKIRLSTFIKCLVTLIRCTAKQKSGTIVFTAIDDYTKWLWLLPILRVMTPGWKYLLIRYRVDDALGSPQDVSGKVRGALVQSVRAMLAANVCCFDERVQQPFYSVLPDPWSGPFGSVSGARVAQDHNWNTNDFIVCLVGFQDKRKGFDVAAEALIKAAEEGFRICLVGRVDDALEHYLNELKTCYGPSLAHYNYYVNDLELAQIMTASSVVLLPYHQKFNATSGVLVRAAASGTSVITSDHGLVGWRTRRWKLGDTFEYPYASQLAEVLVRASLTAGSIDKSSAEQFANSSTTSALTKRFSSVLQSI